MPSPRAARALRRAAAAAVLVVLALAATAPAATLSESLNGGLNYTAAFGERNDLKLRQTGDLVIVEDIVPIRESHPRCITTSTGAIGCSRLPIGATARVQLLDGDDVFTGAALLPTEVIAGGGNDRYVAGRAPGISRVSFDAGADTGDAVDFSTASGPSVLHAEDVLANDGRGFDKDLVKGVERVAGSPFGDTLIGSEAGETFAPGGGDDTVETRGGADLVDMGSVRDGADRIAGDVDDVVSYRLRTKPLLVSVSEGTRNDGEAFEDDDIVGVGSVRGGKADDTLAAAPQQIVRSTELEGDLGDDTLVGAEGADRLSPGPGVDTVRAGGGVDIVRSFDAAADDVDCGAGDDIAIADVPERVTIGCERVSDFSDRRPAERVAVVGTLTLTPRDAAVDAGGATTLAVDWAHPTSWRKLRRLDVAVLDGRKVIAGVSIAPGPRRIRSRGAGVSLLTANGVVARKGRSASARLRLSVPRRLAGKVLRIDVAAVDARGRRQVERFAGAVQVIG